MKLSIIIPAYEAQDHIERCIASLLNQKLSPTDYEILVVDDGSADLTAPIVLGLSKKWAHVYLISQEHNGPGSARNNGLTKAKGEYILFVDADDYVMEETIHRLLGIAQEDDLDILMADHYNVERGAQPIQNKNHRSNTTDIVSGGDFLKRNEISWQLWVYLFKRDFVTREQLHFRENAFFTDTEFSLKAIFYANRVKYVEVYFYSWVFNPSSITRGQWTNKKISDAVVSLRIIQSFAQEVKGADHTIYPVFQRQMSAKCYGLIKNSTALGFLKTRDVCHLIKLEFFAELKEFKFNYYFSCMKMLIRLNPTFAAFFIFLAGSASRMLRRLFV